MRTWRCQITQKEKPYENISCFNLQSRTRVCGRRCARRKQIKEASEEKADAISAARSRAERRTTENKRPTAGDYRGGTPGGRRSTEDESVTTARYTGWADSGRCSARPEVKEIER